MRGLLATFWAGMSGLLTGASRITLFPPRWFANGAEWCDRRARSLSEPRP